ncbi:hypothetical protein ACFU8T_21180 [Sphingobacterium spiritivorum]|nr:hypothetical protein [Sphingobacterium spiritivorum]QQT34764.1 hypothetical protein I6J01_15860 [Sphingobacterium spiritivorum]WQD35651.1 hypothetical protein U0038_07810 [Sphingobacterium spiritivorum]SUJ01238.1 Uncharacterised protein [Sphingobacterium spiritivorum]
MKTRTVSLISLICVSLFSACDRQAKQRSIEIYYENGNAENNKKEFPEFEKIQNNSPEQIRDLGELKIDSVTFNQINKHFSQENNSQIQNGGAEDKGKYNMYIQTENGDRFIVDNTNAFYSLGQRTVFTDDSLAYLIRDHIHYYNSLKLSELKDFEDFMKYQKHIKYDYLSLVDTTANPAVYSKIVLLPQQ